MSLCIFAFASRKGVALHALWSPIGLLVSTSISSAKADAVESARVAAMARTSRDMRFPSRSDDWNSTRGRGQRLFMKTRQTSREAAPAAQGVHPAWHEPVREQDMKTRACRPLRQRSDGGITRQAEQKGMCTMPLAEQGSGWGPAIWLSRPHPSRSSAQSSPLAFEATVCMDRHVGQPAQADMVP